jgi:hypothetical protein
MPVHAINMGSGGVAPLIVNFCCTSTCPVYLHGLYRENLTFTLMQLLEAVRMEKFGWLNVIQ